MSSYEEWVQGLLRKPKAWNCPIARNLRLCEICQRMPRPRCLYCGGNGYRVFPYKGRRGVVYCPHWIGARIQDAERRANGPLKAEREVALRELEELKTIKTPTVERAESAKVCWRLSEALADFLSERGSFDAEAFKSWIREWESKYLDEPNRAEEHPETFSEELVRLEDELGF